MDIVGNRNFVEVPGTKIHELPPLLVKTEVNLRLDKLLTDAQEIVDQEEMIPILTNHGIDDKILESRRIDLAVNLVDQYCALTYRWHWGNAVLEWIRQCETTFGAKLELRNLLSNHVWPHAGRSSFVTLLNEKKVEAEGITLEQAVGLRLSFRQMPPIRCCSDQFLFYLNNTFTMTAYQTWENNTPAPLSSLPPERFEFQVINMPLRTC